LPKVRVRQHVNPFCDKYQTPLKPPNWNEIYREIDRPLHLDIGCARGAFLRKMAQLKPDVNFLGIEIREPLVTVANLERDRLNLKNLHYIFTNINISLPVLLASLPVGILQYVTIQFPDPWFKNKHSKRRVVQPELVDAIASNVVDEGNVFLQSDIEIVAKEMSDRFESHPSFQKQHQETWLATNPLTIPTERELYVIERGGQIYRTLYKKFSLQALAEKI
jgi:tRNA (guanine-N7-)-methyltransferase